MLLAACGVAPAAVTVFFDGSQSYTLVSSATNADTIESEGYLFTYTMDKLFTGGVGMTEPIGRTSQVSWPTGLHAQAITTGPSIGVGANLTVSRVDGQVFDINAITFQLWANTAGAGGTLEIMPLLDGEDLYNDPVMFGATGYYSQSFSYADGGGYQSSTSTLKGRGRVQDAPLCGLGAEIADGGRAGVCAAAQPCRNRCGSGLLLRREDGNDGGGAASQREVRGQL
jgi:hypothetical protein